jgi:hypothetical protein
MAAPIRIEAQGQAMLANHLRQSPEAVPSSSTRKAERMALVASSSVTIRSSALCPESHSCREPPELVEGQHHARHRPARPLAPMRPAPLRPFQQTPRMQERLGPGVAPAEMVIAHQMLGKMLGREAGCDKALPPAPPDPPEPACPTPWPRRLSRSPLRQRPQNAGASAGTSAPRPPKAPPLPIG